MRRMRAVHCKGHDLWTPAPRPWPEATLGNRENNAMLLNRRSLFKASVKAGATLAVLTFPAPSDHLIDGRMESDQPMFSQARCVASCR